MERAMLGTALIEDLNRLACPAEQERFASDPDRVRHALDRLRFIDTSEIDRYGRDGWLAREELDLIERFLAFARERMGVIPGGVDALDWTRCDPGWQLARERAAELLEGLDGFIDLGVEGWARRRRA
jgi:hypothetical protein